MILEIFVFQTMDLTTIFMALFDQLEIRNRDHFAFGALLRHREFMGSQEFSRFTDKMDVRQKNTFRILSQSIEDKDFHLGKKRPKDGVSFGMIPNSMINRLMDKHNRTMRAEGAIMLIRELESAADSDDNKLTLLLPYMGSFVKFLGSLLSDASPKVRLLVCSKERRR